MEPVSAIKSQRAETSPAPRALRIGFVPDTDIRVPAGAERAWRAGRIGLATLSATDLRYGWFAFPVDFEVGGHAFLSASREPLVDIMFSLAHSLHTLCSRGSAEIDFTENSYVIRLRRDGEDVEFTSSYAAPAVAPRCPVQEYVEGVCAFVGTGVEWLVEHRPALAENPALHELRALVRVPVGDGDADGGSESQ
jgi:hypothetical protein